VSPTASRIQADLAGLAKSPRELWLIYGIKFLESLAYFAIYNLLAVYLTEDLNYGDKSAGTIAGTWLTVVSILMFVSGFVADALGIRKALLISVLSCLAGRTMMAVSSSPTVALAGLFVSAWGAASMLPTMTAAIRRYTTPSTVAFGFSLFYVDMNIGALVAPLTIGWFRRLFRQPLAVDLPGFGTMHWSASQLIFLVGAIATLLALFLVLAMRPDKAADTATPGLPGEVRKSNSPLAIFNEVRRERTFWGFMLFVSLLVLVRLIFQHAHLTWPKYSMREFGKDFDFAWYWSINPAMIILLTPVVTALTRTLSAYACIIVGSFISCISVFAMAASTSVTASVVFIVALSLGEALWSPRLYEYTARIAPPGREASYMGLSQIPMFVAKPIVGWLSGSMLAAYCPESGPRNSQMMWAIIGAMTLVGPVLILGLRSIIETPEAARRTTDAKA
jgi:dipeptide/tripeptide permease